MSNYDSWWTRLQVSEARIRSSSRYLISLVIISMAIGALGYGIWLDNNEPQEDAEARLKLKLLEVELNAQNQQLANMELELSLEKTANQDMKAMFAEQHKAQKELDRELAFYRSIMAPENNAQGVAIHGLELSEGMTPGTQKLKLVLTQLKKRKSLLKGRASIKFIGLQDGKVKEISLKELSKLAFSFRYFQVFEEEFSLPEQFILSRIQVKVNVPKSRWAKAAEAEQVFNVSELLELEKEQRVLLEQNSQVKDNSEQPIEVRGSND